ncbi:uncharacterized protein Dana_GF15287 [Drosophila ananassae]|uniref:EF-hand domain-containing protein n=1 Tax=Drosophila ananassae TaxID=7217 RepID=B3MPK2_DROAN|nr:myosin-2 essential light chain [Drosophila ananassae]EDV31298.1 uncharacterized protein Dana_GF15287 [Drosophila ananassae]
MSKAGNQVKLASIHSSSFSNDHGIYPLERNRLLPSMPPPSSAPAPNPKPSKKPHILELHEIFLMHDHRGDNKISIIDLGDCLRVMGANPSEAVVRKHMRQLEAGCLHRISFDECLAVYSSLGKHASRPSTRRQEIETEQFISGLRLLDAENTGFLSAKQLIHILTRCGECLSQIEADELLQGRINEKGMVNYKDLVQFIVTG